MLASASPRRLELLRQIGVVPTLVEPAALDETQQRSELPAALALRLAVAKAAAVAARHPGAIVLGADTVVACGRRVLPKAEHEGEARACLGLLAGRRHRVPGGIAVVAADGQLQAYRHEGFWDCMDTYKDAVELNDLWASACPPWPTFSADWSFDPPIAWSIDQSASSGERR